MISGLFKGTIIGIIQKAVGALGILLLLPLMLQKLGPTNFGIWVTISSSVNLISFLDLGTGSALMSYIALNPQDKKGIVNYIKLAYLVQCSLIGAIVLSFILGFRFINWSSVFNIDNAQPDIVFVIFIAVVCFLLTLITNSAYAIQRGLQQSTTTNIWQLISTLLCLFGVWLALLINPSLKLIAILTFGIPLIISGINTLVFAYRQQLYQNFFSLNINTKDLLKFTSSSGSLLFLQLAALICFETDCLILAHYASYDDVAQFTIAARIYSVPAVLFTVYLQILWPAYSNALSIGNWYWIRKIFYRTLLLSTTACALFIAFVFIFKDIALNYWLFDQISISTSLFIAFSFWTIASIVDANIATILNGLNKIKVQAYLAAIMIVFNLLLSIFLVKRIGPAGVIWGSFFASLLFSITPFYFYIKNLFTKMSNNNR